MEESPKHSQRDLLDLSQEDDVPYFMWDYRYSLREIRSILRGDDARRRLWLMAKIMRDARYADVWKFLTLDEFLEYRNELLPRLGRQSAFWEFMYSRWVKQGIVADENHSHSVEFDARQTNGGQASNLASGVHIYKLQAVAFAAAKRMLIAK